MEGTIPPVRIGIYDPFEVYPKVSHLLNQKVQLTNLHWRKNSSDALRSITQLPYEIVEETPKFFDNHSPSTLKQIEYSESALADVINLLQTPYTRLMFIQCDNLDVYRAQVRPLVTAWKEGNIEKANCPIDWTLVYLQTDPNSKSQPKVFDKLKIDNNLETDGTDHCVLLKTSYLNPLEENESWGALVSRLKMSILFSFSKRLEILREALLKIEDNPLLTIALKEGVARQFFNLHLIEDSINEYNYLLNLVNEKKDLLATFENQLVGLGDVISAHALFNSESDTPSEFYLKFFVFTRFLMSSTTIVLADTSLSVSTIRVSELLTRLTSFIADVSTLFNGSIEVNKWIYTLVDQVLKLSICSKILNTEDLPEESLLSISEKFGELFLLERSNLLLLGSTLKNYHVNGVLTDIPIYDQINITLDIDDHLKSVLSSKEDFEQRFLELTEAAIRHYALANRPRTVDVLSIDIALLDYQNGDHDKAAIVLASCPDFYGTEGWKFISYHLLEIYIDCLEHMKPDDEFFTKSKEVFLAENYVYLLSSLNNDNSIIPKSTLKATLEKLYKLDLNDLPEEIRFNFSEIFSFEIDPYVVPVGSDTFEINLNLKTSLDVDFQLQDIKITLHGDRDQDISFTLNEATLNGQNNRIKLLSKSIFLGAFKIQSIYARLGHVSLFHELEIQPEVFIFPSPDDLTLRVDHSTSLNLTDKTFSIFLTSSNEVRNVQFELKQIDGTLDVSDPIKTFEDGVPILTELQKIEDLKITHVKPSKLYEVIVPFKPDLLASKLLGLFVNVKFESKEGEAKSQSTVFTLDTSLKIEVSVQDIFKFDSLYSKFSIGTSDPDVPVRLINVDLDGEGIYNVETALKAGELVAFTEQPGNYFFRLKKVDDAIQNGDIKLQIEYRDLLEECTKIWNMLLWDALDTAGLHIYHRLFTGLLSLKVDYINYELDSSIIFQSHKYDTEILKYIPLKYRSTTHKIITDLISSKHEIPANTSFISNHLFIKVPIPTVEILQQYELKLEHAKMYTTLGESLIAKLTIKSLVNKHGIEKTTKKVSFQDRTSNRYDVEIVSTSDSWLINGQTKFSFELFKDSTENDEEQFKEKTFELSLIPLKIGKLTLPRIKITKEDISFKLDEYALEIDYKNETETIYVVS